MKRFWRAAAAVEAKGGWTVALDGKPVRTPARAALVVPGRALAEAIAAEWDAQDGEVRPQAMVLTGLANAAIDRAGPEVAGMIAAYGAHDLTCYRADGPAELIARQAAAWEPLIAWATRRYDVAFRLGVGVTPVDQPAATLTRMRAAVDALDGFRLAGMYPGVSVTGSLLIGLALLEHELDAEGAWATSEIDAAWQAEKWGDDPLAQAARAERRAALLAGARFLGLL